MGSNPKLIWSVNVDASLTLTLGVNDLNNVPNGRVYSIVRCFDLSS